MFSTLVVIAMVAPVVAEIFVPFVAAIRVAIAFVPVATVFPVARHVFIGVPVVLHEVNPLAAGLVSVAVLTPVFGMAGRNAQVDGRAVYMNTLDDGRLWMEEHWRRVTAHIDPAIKPGLADVYRYANIGGECWRTQGGAKQHQRNQYPFHVFVSFSGPLFQLNQRTEDGSEDVAIATGCKYT